MSSDHTRVDCEAWKQKQEYISSTDAYVIEKQQEEERIYMLVREELEKARAIHDACEKKIQESLEILKKAYAANFDKLDKRMQEDLAEQKEALGTQLDSLCNEVKDTSVRIDKLNREIDVAATNYQAIFEQTLALEKGTDSRARAVLAELDRMLERMQDLEPERFMKTEYNALTALRESVCVNLDAGDSQAAIAVSQEGILKSAKLLVKLQLVNEQYKERHLELSKKAAKIREKIERLASKEGVLKIDDAEIDYDISLWSFGTFDRLVEMFEGKEQFLKTGRLTIKDLENFAIVLEDLESDIDVCDATARKERVGALAVTDMVVRLYKGMLGSGWKVTDSGYDEEDKRKSYKLKFGESSGNEVAFVVAPESAEQPSILMEAFSDSEAHTERIKNSVHTVLGNAGVEIVGRERRNDCHENPKADIFIDNALNEAEGMVEQRRMAEQQIYKTI